MKSAAVILGTLALNLPVPVRSAPLQAHLMNSVEVNLADDRPIRLPVRIDLSRIPKKYDEDLVCCHDCKIELFALEPFSILLHADFVGLSTTKS